MAALKWLLGLLLALAAFVFGGAAMMPKTFTVTRSVDVAAPASAVYALVEDPRQWKRWSAWNRRDPNMQITYSGPNTGVGAGWAWKSPSEGSGAMTFTAAEAPQRIAYELSFPEFDSKSTGEMKFEARPSGTRVTWTMNGNAGGKLLFRWMAPFADRLVGPDFEAGLANLKAEAERS